MASPSPTELVYHSGESVGMAVSCPSSVICHELADPMCIFFLLVDRSLRHALVGVSLEYVRYPRSMSHFTNRANLNVLTLPFCDVGLFHSQMSAVPSSHSSDESPFARTHIGRYFLSLLMCNLVQGIGAVLNFPWMVEGRVYVGRTCAAQATINRIGGVRDLLSFRLEY